MPESSLNTAFRELQAEIGEFLGYGRGSAIYGETAWSATQQGRIDSYTKSGLRKFYFPPPLDGERTSYKWSFLKPVASLTTASGTNTLTLPDDFGGLEGRITVSTTSGGYWPVDVTNDGRIMEMYAQTPSTTGRTALAGIQWLKGTGTQVSQRAQLLLWPIPDAAYILQFRYYLLPDMLTVALPYAYGGAAHAETALEACLSVAESRGDDSMGVHEIAFKERLAASIAIDATNKPQLLGYDGDRSDGYDDWPGMRQHGQSLVTFNSVLPG